MNSEKNLVDLDEVLAKNKKLKKTYEDFCGEAYEEHDKCDVWIDEDGDDWWLNLQHPWGVEDGVDHGFKICKVYARKHELIVSKFLIAIGKAKRFLGNLKK